MNLQIPTQASVTGPSLPTRRAIGALIFNGRENSETPCTLACFMAGPGEVQDRLDLCGTFHHVVKLSIRT